MVGNASSGVALNERTGAVQPASIGVMASPVAVSVLVSMAFKAAALFFPGYVPLGLEEATTQLVLGGISLAADGFALYKRWRSPLQPIKLGGPSAAAVILLLALPLGGCITVGQRNVVSADLTPASQNRADVALAKAAAQVTQYCAALQFGLGVAELFVVNRANIVHTVRVQQAQAAVNAYCVAPPTDVYGALRFVAEAYRGIMTVPAVSSAVRQASLTLPAK